MKIFINIVKNTFLVFLGTVISFVFLQSLLTTVKYDVRERPYFTNGQPNIIIIMGIICFYILYIIQKKVCLSSKQIKYILTGFFCFNIFLILISQKTPIADQYAVFDYVERILMGDFSGFAPSDYVGLYPFQKNIIIFYVLLFGMFGANNYIAVWLINAIVLWLVYDQLYKELLIRAGEKKAGEVIIVLIMFLPASFYLTFIYGTVIGFCFAVLSIIQQQKFFRTKSWKNLLLSCVCIGFSCFLKTNFCIFLIGIIIVYIGFITEEKGEMFIQCIGGIAGAIISYFAFCILFVSLLSLMTENISNNVMGGIPKEHILVLGLQESEERGVGAYSNYGFDIYTQYNYNTEEAKEAVLKDLKKEIDYKLNHFWDSVHFFSKKMAVLWSEPTFDIFHYHNPMQGSLLGNYNGIYNNAVSVSGRLNKGIRILLDTYQSLIYLGVIIYIFLYRKKAKLYEYVGLIIFFGSVIAYLFGESCSAYTWYFFILLIPYAVLGYARAFDTFKISKFKKSYHAMIPWVLGAVALLLLAEAPHSADIIRINEDTEKWDIYVRNHNVIPEGYYYLTLKDTDKIVSLDCEEGKTNVVNKNEADVSDKLYIMTNNEGEEWEYFLSADNNFLGYAWDENWKLYMVQNEELDNQWKIEKINGGYCIKCNSNGNKVLTYDEINSSLLIEDYQENNMNQIWELKRYI